MRQLADGPHIKKSAGPRNAPAPQIPPPTSAHGSFQQQPAKPLMYPQQLNPLSAGRAGQPQYSNRGIPVSSEPTKDHGLSGDSLKSLIQQLMMGHNGTM
jgi:hypothetical protein